MRYLDEIIPPPRESRLREAALTLLAAATAAVLLFGHIAAQDINPDPPNLPEPHLPKGKGIEITQMGPYYPQTTNAVEDGWHAVYLFTDRPFSQVDWYVNDQLEFTERASYDTQTDSYFSHQYENGSTTGAEAVVEAVAYPRFHDPRIWTGDSKEMTVKVFKDNGFIWRETGVEIYSIVPIEGEHNYELRTLHYASYYNDTGAVQLDIVTNLGWGHGHGPDNIAPLNDDHDLHAANETHTFDSMETIPRKLGAALWPGHFYSVMGYTRFESDKNDESKSEATSGPGVQYDDNMNLPPVGQSAWKRNENKDVEFLWE